MMIKDFEIIAPIWAKLLSPNAYTWSVSIEIIIIIAVAWIVLNKNSIGVNNKRIAKAILSIIIITISISLFNFIVNYIMLMRLASTQHGHGAPFW